MNDDELLKKFFAEQTMDIADDGFSEKVTSHLPRNIQQMDNIWTVFCIVMALVAFIAFKGWHSLLVWFKDVFMSFAAFLHCFTLSDINMSTIVTVVLTMAVLSVLTLFFVDKEA